MKLRTVIAVASVLAFSLACGGGTSAFDDDGDLSFEYKTELTAPWTDMGIPVADGTTVLSTDTSVAINYTKSVSEMTQIYKDYLKGQGYSETYADDSTGTFTGMYAKDGKNIAIAVMESMGKTVVSLTMS